MTNTEVFERIRQNHSEKKILSLTDRLMKKCSFHSGRDAEFPGKGGYNVWDFLLYIWGLEVYLLKSEGNEKAAAAIIYTMDKYWSSSPLSKEAEEQRRNSFTYEVVSYAKEIDIIQCKTKEYIEILKGE